ncbi:KxYKxGKxW signal peptide domain-containing protein [Levilactobacillus yonginensis]|uniref:KxYKxGKxW signal peptide domain-containing protein n=1 Tax=Levilactobacillus yonginensis TaxID=1054041 RepID=UPI000F79F673|nr:KxYKxGKxW signal peptide domain-containing protein [Levilactobacillus yonginensis]
MLQKVEGVSKEHYKSYKAGKRWVFACITVLALGVGLASVSVAQADTTDPDVAQSSVVKQDAGSVAKPAGVVDGQTKEQTSDDVSGVKDQQQDPQEPATQDKEQTTKEEAPAAPEKQPEQIQNAAQKEDQESVTKDEPKQTEEPVQNDGQQAPKQVSASAPKLAVDRSNLAKVAKPSIDGVDASVWMPSQAMRTWVENVVQKSAPWAKITDANLYQFIENATTLTTSNYSGTIPMPSEFEGLQYFTNLQYFDYGYDIPADQMIDFSFAPNLKQLDLGGLKGTATTKDVASFFNTYLASNTKLSSMDVSHFGLTGTIPDLSRYTALSYLNMANNNLSGDLSGIAGLASLNNLNLANNQLTGSVPSLSNWPDIQYLYINNNRLSGDLPDLSNFTGMFYGVYNEFSSGMLDRYNGSTQINNYSYYQFLNGKSYTLTAKDRTFDPITNVVSGVQDGKTGQLSSDPIILTQYSKGVRITYGAPDDTVAMTDLLAWEGKQENATSWFTVEADPTNKLGFNLVANADAPDGTYYMAIQNNSYTSQYGGYIAYVSFEIKNDQTPVVDPGTGTTTTTDPTPGVDQPAVVAPAVDATTDTDAPVVTTGGDAATIDEADQPVVKAVVKKASSHQNATVQSNGQAAQVTVAKTGSSAVKASGQVATVAKTSATASDQTANQSAAKTTLPQTNEQSTASVIVAGIAMLLATLGLGVKARKND